MRGKSTIKLITLAALLFGCADDANLRRGSGQSSSLDQLNIVQQPVLDPQDDEDQGGNNNSQPRVSCTDFGTIINIGNNVHSHALVVPKEDVIAGTAMTYDLQGAGDHNHQITLSALDFMNLTNNEQVVMASTLDNGHDHLITIDCAEDPLP